MIGVSIFVSGLWIGQYLGVEHGGSWNPLNVYHQLWVIENSPFAWVSTGLYEESRTLRHAMMGGAATILTGGVGWYVKGPLFALRSVTSAARVWESTGSTWRSWQRGAETQANLFDSFSADGRRPLLSRLGDAADWAYAKQYDYWSSERPHDQYHNKYNECHRNYYSMHHDWNDWSWGHQHDHGWYW